VDVIQRAGDLEDVSVPVGGAKIPNKRAAGEHPPPQAEQLLGQKAFQKGARIGLDRQDLERARLLEHVRVSTFQRTEIEDRLTSKAAELLRRPENALVLEQRHRARTNPVERPRQARHPFSVEDADGRLWG